MSDDSVREQAVDMLQELGLKEYEAKCYGIVVIVRRLLRSRLPEEKTE